MQARFGWWLIGWTLWAELRCTAIGQTHTQTVSVSRSVANPAVPTSAAGVITAAAARAGVIFAGQVIAIDREDASGFVDVRFHVDQAVRGCGTGDTYVLREWAGLWSGQINRYREGERLLMLLAPRGRGGMSAPVDGLAGAIPLVAARQQPLVDARGLVPAETTQQETLGQGVDLRWVETLAARRTFLTLASATPRSGESTGEWRGVVASLAMAPNPKTPGAAVQSATPSLASVLALLGQSRVVAYPVDR